MAVSYDAEAYANLCERIDRFIDVALECGRCEACSQQTELVYFAVNLAFPDDPDALCTLRERLTLRGYHRETKGNGNDVYCGVRLKAEHTPSDADEHLYSCFP